MNHTDHRKHSNESKSDCQRVLDGIGELIARDKAKRGPVTMRPLALDEWLAHIDKQLKDARRHAAYGNNLAAMDSLLTTAKECVQCLEYHIDQEAENVLPGFQAALAELDLTEPAFSHGGVLKGHPPAPPSKGDKKTANPAATGSAV